MPVENVRGYMAAFVAAAAVIGGAIGAVYVWQRAIGIDPPPDTTLIFGVFTGLIGSGSTFLFMSDAGARASHAAERAVTAGAVASSTASSQGAAQALSVPVAAAAPVAGDVLVEPPAPDANEIGTDEITPEPAEGP